MFTGGVGLLVTALLLLEIVVRIRGVRVRLTRKSRPGVGAQVTGHGGPDPGILRRGDGKDCALPLPPKEWGARWASLALFFLDSGLGEVCTGYTWNLPSEGTGVGFSGRSVQLSLACMVRHTWSAPPPPPPHHLHTATHTPPQHHHHTHHQRWARE